MGYSDANPKEILDHFGIKQEDLEGCDTFMPLNREGIRENTGIAIAERSLNLKKARITIDYDADFDFVLMRITSL